MFARTLDGTCRPEKLDAVIHCTHDALRQMGHFEGFIGKSFIADRATGRCITTS